MLAFFQTVAFHVGGKMKKQNLKEESKETPKRLSWNKFRELPLDEINKIIAEHDRVLIYTLNGDFYELRELDI